jgi:preprotein translocase subunit SecY
MATNANDLRSTNSGLSELRSRLFFVLFAIVIFRLGSFIPVPGIDSNVLAELMKQQAGTILELFNTFSGGALERASIFALGIMPYITASIMVQILSYVEPSMQQLKKEGESGKKKLSQYTRWGTLVLATAQATGIALNFPNLAAGLVADPGMAFYFTAIVSLVTGTMFIMWLGEQINERGIGNGISILIFVGIVAGLPAAVGQTAEQARQGEIGIITLFAVMLLVAGVTWFVVFVERGQRRLVVNYAKRQQGRKVYAAQSSHLPFKINMAGVIPAIFASSIILFPGTILQWFGGGADGPAFLQELALSLQPGQPLYILLYGAGIVFFCFFYTALVFNPRETSDNLKRSGAFIPGIRPGEQTSKYIDKVITRITFWGALYMAAVCLLPEFMILFANIPFNLGGTSLLIIVVVIMDFMAQIQSHLLSQQYSDVLKKANFKNYGPSGQVR